MSPTSVPDAQDALLAQLQAREDLADALVQLGLPVDVPMQRERVYIDDMRDMDRERVAQQDVFRETYILPVLVEVRSVGRDDRAACRTRAYEIVDEVAAAIEADRELAGAAHDCVIENVPRQVTQPLTDGWVTKILIDVRVLTLI